MDGFNGPSSWWCTDVCYKGDDQTLWLSKVEEGSTELVLRCLLIFMIEGWLMPFFGGQGGGERFVNEGRQGCGDWKKKKKKHTRDSKSTNKDVWGVVVDLCLGLISKLKRWCEWSKAGWVSGVYCSWIEKWDWSQAHEKWPKTDQDEEYKTDSRRRGPSDLSVSWMRLNSVSWLSRSVTVLMRTEGICCWPTFQSSLGFK